MDTIYKQRANGRWEYWTYSEGLRYFVSGRWAEREVNRKRAKIVLVGA